MKQDTCSDVALLDSAGTPQQQGTQKRKVLLLLIFIVLVAAAARYYQLGTIPRGLYMDEAADANDALSAISHHHFAVFYPSDGGREGLWIGMMSLSIRALGRSILAVRRWAPIIGVLTVLAMYFLGRRWFSQRTGLLAAWLMATSSWHILFSRVAFRGILVPLFLVTSVLFLQMAWDARDRRWIFYALIGGVLYGLGFYSYIAFRITPLLIVVLLAMEWKLKSVEEFKQKFSRGAVWAITAILVILPLCAYFVAHPLDFSNRTNEVAVWSSSHPLVLLASNTVRELWMFIGKGDGNWRHNLRPMPELLYPIGLLFVVGAVVIWRRRVIGEERLRGVVVLAWLAIMALPAVLTRESVPHALRSIGALPAAILLAAIGADWMFRQLSGRKALTNVFISVIFMAGVVDVVRYFTLWASSPNVQYAYQLPQTELAKALRRLPTSTKVLVVVEEPTDFDWRSHAYKHVNPNGQSVVLPLQAQIPLFLAGERNKIMYLPSGSANASTLRDLYGCADIQFNPVSLPRDTLVLDKHCPGLVLARLSSRDQLAR